MWIIDASDIFYHLIEKLVAADVNDVRYMAGIRDAITLIKKAKNVADQQKIEAVTYESSIEVEV